MLESDKATMDVPSPVAGTIASLDVAVGEHVSEGTLIGTVEVVEKDDAAHRAVLRVRSREEGGTGHANADVTFQLRDGGGDIHTNAQITGKAASMGEGVMVSVIDALIKDFTEKLKSI